MNSAMAPGCNSSRAACAHYDAKVRGLAVCVTSTGLKTFYLYARMDRRPTRYRIGAWPEVSVAQARDIATKRLAEVVDGRNPHRERIAKRHQLTLTKLFHRWVAEHAKVRIKSWRIDDSRFRNYVEPEFGDRALESIESEELLSWHRRLGEQRGRVIANRVLCLVSRVFSWAERFGIYRGRNPCESLPGFPRTPANGFLQPDEAPRFFAALDAEPQLWQDLFRCVC
ncbi:MAG: tyrosine-type recombinase/integrase [Thermoguttaceae bacterium]